MKFAIFLAAVCTAAVLAGCASPRLATPDGFPKLTVEPNDESTMVFTRPGLDLARYRKVYVEPVQMLSRVADKESKVTTAEAQELAAYARQQFTEQLGKSFQLVDAPGADVLRLRFTITDLQPTSAAQVVMMVPPFAMINMVSPKGAFIGSITLAGEFFEGTATEPGVAFVAYRSRPGVDATVAFGRWTAARKIIGNAAERLTRDLVSLQPKS